MSIKSLYHAIIAQVIAQLATQIRLERTKKEGVIKIGQLAEKLQTKGPQDLSENLDKYTWDESKNNQGSNKN